MKKSQPGTYMILNKITGTRYIGSAARSISQRWQEHRFALRRNMHGNPYLQNSWNKHGEAAFAFVLLENCPVDQVLTREAWWSDTLKRQGHKLYNLKPAGQNSQLGFVPSQETRDKIAKANTGQKRTPEQKARMGWQNRGKPNPATVLRNSKPYSVISPDGQIFSGSNIAALCLLHGLDFSAMAKVNKGIRPSHKGWRKAP